MTMIKEKGSATKATERMGTRTTQAVLSHYCCDADRGSCRSVTMCYLVTGHARGETSPAPPVSAIVLLAAATYTTQPCERKCM